MNHKLKVQIIEPSPIITEGLKAILCSESDFDLLTPLNELDEFSIQTEQPDVLILNPTVLPYNEQFDRIFEAFPNCTIVALIYQYVEPTCVQKFHGIIDIREQRQRIPERLREAQKNIRKQTQPTENYELTERETEVLVLVAQGLMTKEIADKLHISAYTVVSHRKNITRKTGIKSVAGLAVYAMLHNLIG